MYLILNRGKITYDPMYVRVKTTPNSPRKSVQIVESVRSGEKVKQRIVRHVGIAMDDQELEKLKELAEHIKHKIKEERQPSLFRPDQLAEMAIEAKKQQDDDPIFVNLKELEEEQRAICGIHEIYGEIYDLLKFNTLFSPNREVGANQILKHITMARIANPSSKRASVINLEKDFGISLQLDQVYRMMDKVDENIRQSIENKSFEATCNLFQDKIDIIFVDATTLYFESFTEDEFKKNGYSKDLKFNQPQVLLALMVTKQGLPIGYEAFPGSMYEGHTLLPLLRKLRDKHNLDKVVFVADSGLFNSSNLNVLEDAGFEYIVGARLKNLPKDLQEKVLDLSNYDNEPLDEEDQIRYCEFLHQERRLIVSHSTKRARKDAFDREKTVEKIRQKIHKSKDPSHLISNHGHKKFVKLQGTSEVVLNEEKIQKAALWDGLHGVISNSSDFSPSEILSQYRGLWQVEESFRITKHDLKIRPIFHWTPERVKAHIALCFMAFTCVRHLEYRVALQYKKLSPEAIRSALVRVQISVLKDRQNKRYAIPSPASQDARKIYQTMGKKYSIQPYRLDVSSKV